MQHEPAGYQILVVEDSAEVSEALVLLLEQHGYRVRTAANGEEAIELLKTQKPRLVFVDLVMPIVSGLELIDVMKRDKALAEIPVVAMTGSSLRPRGVRTVKKPFAVPGLLCAAKFYCDAK
jgi:CheY-like chemotaxis protein